VSKRQSAEGRKQKAEGGNQMVFALTPDTWHLTPDTWHLNPESSTFHNPTYYPSLSSPICQETWSPLPAGIPAKARTPLSPRRSATRGHQKNSTLNWATNWQATLNPNFEVAPWMSPAKAG